MTRERALELAAKHDLDYHQSIDVEGIADEILAAIAEEREACAELSHDPDEDLTCFQRHVALYGKWCVRCRESG